MLSGSNDNIRGHPGFIPGFLKVMMSHFHSSEDTNIFPGAHDNTRGYIIDIPYPKQRCFAHIPTIKGSTTPHDKHYQQGC